MGIKDQGKEALTMLCVSCPEKNIDGMDYEAGKLAFLWPVQGLGGFILNLEIGTERKRGCALNKCNC